MNNQLSKTLRLLMGQRKLNARDLARETGLSISRISDLVNGRAPSLKNLQVLASYFDVSLDYLVHGADSQRKESIDELDFEDLFEGIVRIKISKLKDVKGKRK